MAKFVYKMQNILDIKSKLEEQAKTQTSVARNKLNQEKEKLKGMFDKKTNYENEIRESMTQKLKLNKIKELENGIEVIKVKIAEQQKEVEIAQKRYDAAMDNLQKLMIERKTQEKLKENKFEEFVKEVGEEENKETDELVSFKYNK